MKQIVSISLGPSKDDYEFESEFLGQDFNIKRLGVDGEMEKAARLVLEWDKKADAVNRKHTKRKQQSVSQFSDAPNIKRCSEHSRLLQLWVIIT